MLRTKSNLGICDGKSAAFALRVHRMVLCGSDPNKLFMKMNSKNERDQTVTILFVLSIPSKLRREQAFFIIELQQQVNE